MILFKQNRRITETIS